MLRILCSCLGLGRFILYLCDLLFSFSLIFVIISHIISLKRTCFLPIFQDISCYVWMITWMKKANSFQAAKVQPQSVAQLLLDFLPISAWRCLYKKAYIKKRVHRYSRISFMNISTSQSFMLDLISFKKLPIIINKRIFYAIGLI